MQLHIEAPHASEVIITGPEALWEWRERHRMKVPGHEYMPRFRRRQWDGTWQPGKWCREKEPGVYEFRVSRGLVRRIVEDLGGAVTFTVAPPEELAGFIRDYPQIEQLRDYQRAAISRVLEEGWGRVAFATNAGKGAVIALLAAFASRRGDAALILCDEIAVFDALAEELRAWGKVDVAYVNQGVKAPPNALVTLAMVPTLARRLGDDTSKLWHQWLLRQKMLLLDEADKGDAATWRSILTSAKNTTWRAGFSGTFPSDEYGDLRMSELMGPVLERVKNAELVERGISAKPTIELHAFENTSVMTSFPHEWWYMSGPERRNWVYEQAVLNNVGRHLFVASLIRPNTPTAVIINRIEHGRALTTMIPGAVFLDGSASEAERLEALERFRRGELLVLVVSKILDRGTNRLGSAADLIFASAEGSATQVLQRIGRGLRRADGKEFLRLVDIVDRITADEDDKKMQMAAKFLEAAVRRRLTVYAQEGFTVQIGST